MCQDQRPASWGKESPKVSARLKLCQCGSQPVAETDTEGFWSATCRTCNVAYLGEDMLGCETWQEIVKAWNTRRSAMSGNQ